MPPKKKVPGGEAATKKTGPSEEVTNCFYKYDVMVF